MSEGASAGAKVGRGLLRPAAALASGVTMAVLVPPFDLGGLVWVAFLPLLAAVWSAGGKRPGWRGFGLGYLAGLGAFVIAFEWLRVVSPVGWIAVAAFLSLYPALWGMFAAKFANPWREAPVSGDDESRIAKKVREKSAKKDNHWRQSLRSLRIAFCVAAVWCLTEWLRSWVFTGFGWNSLGVAFHRTPVMAQSADLLGICGLSFLPVFLQAVLVQTGLRLWQEAKGGKLRPHIDFGVAATLIALAFCYGVWRLHTVGKQEGVRLKVLLVQLNIPQEAARRLWSPTDIHLGYEEETLKALRAIEEQDAEAFEKAAAEGGDVVLNTPDWVMWPESSLVGRILRLEDGSWGTWDENLQTMSRVFGEGDFTLVMGLNEIEGEMLGDAMVEKENARVWNSLVLLNPQNDLQTFRKHHLVIFGEYIPLVEELPFLKTLYEQQSGAQYGGAFSKGESFDPLIAEVEGETVGLIPTVCFEDTVPRLMRRFVRSGPQLILNVTNDGWFKDSPAAAQHYANAKFRAIELRRPMVRCANTGVSAAVNSVGSSAHPVTGEPQELRDEDGSHLTRGWLLADVRIPTRPALSLYAVIGDAGVVVLGLLGLVVGVAGRRKG
ncbi:apolipoprotein N-acyltransferase [Haloferula helveola]|uniref:Apolipoprotein N-acyltransferase n=1 Tax=Haloferula helveola TaxID=490095 RepID=A0ABN6HAB0_9BACT|nr:apolipoprotein N-acyltransferase [Haloferula helveola]